MSKQHNDLRIGMQVSAAARLATVLAAVCISTGCGDSAGYKVAPVSGVVTLDGQPAPNVEVTFQPIGTTENPNPGPSASGRADAAGRFSLKTVRDEPGAVVGKNRVRITTPPPPRSGGSDSGVGEEIFRDPIPARYNASTELEFDVPSGGTDQADFPLTTP